jgi:hypothetical protein
MMILASWPPSSTTDPADHRSRLGIEPLDSERDRVDLLNELGTDERVEAPATRAGDEDAGVGRGHGALTLDPLEELKRLLGLLGIVSLVVGPDDLVALAIDHHCLDRGRSDVQADHVSTRARRRAHPLTFGFSQPGLPKPGRWGGNSTIS